MTDKKILDAEQKKIVDEVLSDDKLEKVASGNSTGHAHACAADNSPLIFNPNNPNNGLATYVTATGK